jgi:glycosyltransferase involved in cell wall biosynthesis
MRIIIATTQTPLVQGGAEFQAEGLAAALVAAGHDVDTVRIPESWGTPGEVEARIRFCLQLDLSSCAGRKVDRLIAFKFPAYLIPHPEKVQWILHQLRWFYDLWSKYAPQIPEGSEWLRVRDEIHKLDKEYISRARAVFATSLNVANRLKRYSGIYASPLYHPPPLAEHYYCDSPGEYLFLPSRIYHLKRQDLVLEALAHTKRPVTVVFAGTAEEPKYGRFLRQRAEELKVNERCRWLEWVTQEEKIRLYAECLAVIFPPYDEDLGYVTLESMLASKPVITCSDSGGPLEFVKNEFTGLVCDPTPVGVAEAMDSLWEDRSLAIRMGNAGRQHYLDMNLSWASVVETLLR